MSGDGPGSWIDRAVGWCFGILLATIALYCAAALIQAMLPVLLVVFGVAGILGIVAGGIVVFRTLRDRW